MYRNGKKNLFGFFMGEAMKKNNGKANPQLLKEIMLEKGKEEEREKEKN